MSQTLEAVYDGVAFLPESPPALKPNTRVRLIVLESGEIDLKSIGISESEAAELRDKFETFEDWNLPEMDMYDHYDEYKSKL